MRFRLLEEFEHELLTDESEILKEGSNDNSLMSMVTDIGKSDGQKNFFKNSKVRDKYGNLLVCYHGTKNPGFTSFNPQSSKSQFGNFKFNKNCVNYFTTSKDSAMGYTDLGIEEDGNIYACYLNIVNPYIVDNKSVAEIKSWSNIKDYSIRKQQIEKFQTEYQYWKQFYDEEDAYEDINSEFLRHFNCELRLEDDDGYDQYFNLWELGNNKMWGKEHKVLYDVTLEELFSNDYYEEFRDAVIGDFESDASKDDYFQDTDTIVRWVLYSNSTGKTDYDGIIIPDILDVGPCGSAFTDYTTDIITLKSPNQIKRITNINPTDSDDIDENINLGEKFWKNTDSSWPIYQPEKDSKFIRLNKKPINQLTLDEIKYIYVVAWCRYMKNARQYENFEEAYNDIINSQKERALEECYEFVNSLTFPLTVYRAIRKDELNADGTLNIKGRSWSSNIDIYYNASSKFNGASDIVTCQINPNAIDNSHTIMNFVFYTSDYKYGGFGEYEISLKSKFNVSDLMGLHLLK